MDNEAEDKRVTEYLKARWGVELKTWDRLVAAAYLHRKAGGRKPHPHFAARIARRYGENLTRAYAWAKAGSAEQSRRDFWEWLQKARKDGRGQDA